MRSGPLARRIACLIGALAACAAPAPAGATVAGPTGAEPAFVAGPLGTRLLAPATASRCSADGMALRVAARWSARAIARPVRAIRVLLQRPGAEAVMASVVFAPARPSTTRAATLRISRCRPDLDVRYELFVGRIDVPHDHTSVVFRTHGTPVS